MYTRSTTTHRFTTRILGLFALIALVFAIAGPGRADSQAAPETTCENTCITAGGVFGPTVPVSVNMESAGQFVAIIDGASHQERPVTMNFLSVDEGSEVVVLATDGEVATVRLSTGRVGYVPTAWVQGA